MTPEEIAEFLEEEKVAIVTSFGPRGWPHSMPLWYLIRDGRIVCCDDVDGNGPVP